MPPGRTIGATRAVAIVAVLALGAGAIGWAAAGGMLQVNTGPGTSDVASGAGASGHAGPSSGGTSATPGTPAAPTPLPSPTPRPPTGGTELYGYLPYWQMTDRMATYLARVPVSTLALFSVNATASGTLKTSDIGYRRITGARGRGLIADAHARGQRVELVFTSFGSAQNTRLFDLSPAGIAQRAHAVSDLVALAANLGVDGVNVDVESVTGDISLGYVGFIGSLRAGLKALGRHATLTVATTTDHEGAELARLAIIGGADRVFLMGYNYHWSGSGPGASAPIQNRDPGRDLTQSIVDYVDTGVPRNKILLGLPLYGMSWPVVGPDLASVALGKGKTWIPASHVDQLTSPDFVPTLDSIEVGESFIVANGASWTATYYDSPRTLAPKLELARSQGLAGSGFWALGYEYGLPGYLDLMSAFRAGKVAG
jgi:hypothetical protein